MTKLKYTHEDKNATATAILKEERVHAMIPSFFMTPRVEYTVFRSRCFVVAWDAIGFAFHFATEAGEHSR